MGRSGRLGGEKTSKEIFRRHKIELGKEESLRCRNPQRNKKKEQENKDSKLIPFEPTQSKEAKPPPVTSEEMGKKTQREPLLPERTQSILGFL